MEECPQEILGMIFENLDSASDISNLRLTNKANGYAGSRHLLRQQFFGYTKPCADQLHGSVSHKYGFGKNTETVVFDPNRLIKQNFKDWCDTHVKAMRLQNPNYDRLFRLDHHRLFIKYCETCQQQINLGCGGTFLKHVIPALFNKMPRLRHVVLASHVEHQSKMEQSAWFTDAAYLRHGEWASSTISCMLAFRGLIEALKERSQRVKSITAIGVDSDLLSRAWAPWLLRYAAGFKNLESVRILFDRSKDRQQLPTLSPTQASHHQAGRPALAEALRAATDLRELKILRKDVPEIDGQFLRLPSIVSDNHWPRLRTVALSSVIAKEAELTEFLLRHRDTLQEVQFRRGHLSTGTWFSLFKSIAGQLPRLTRIRIYDSLTSQSDGTITTFMSEFEFDQQPTSSSPRGRALQESLQSFLINGGIIGVAVLNNARSYSDDRDILRGETYDGLEYDDVWDQAMNRLDDYL